MIKIYPAQSRNSGNHGWLQYNFSFSFADYYDPENLNFGPLRVFNDDFIQPSNGFGMHPHRDMEIFTVVLQGELKHQDSMGNTEILRPGEVQRMTAGTGIIHSEINSSATEVANTLQLWFLPEKKGLTPTYEQKAYDVKAMKNNLLPVLSNSFKGENIAYIHQDLTLYLSELESGASISFGQKPNRKIYLFVMEGDLLVNEEAVLNRRDTARIVDLSDLEMRTNTGAKFMLIDLP